MDMDRTTVTLDEEREEVPAKTCVVCDYFKPCEFEGHEDVGFCLHFKEFQMRGDEGC